MPQGETNYQGGKQYGERKDKQQLELDTINQQYLEDTDYADEDDFPDLKGTLQNYKEQFMKYDENNSGDIDIMELKLMMEKLGQAKTHLELKKMIQEVDRENRGAISYNDFVFMMLGGKTSVLKLILKFEEKMKGKDKPTGVAPKRDLSSLP